jgi:hypothetical protein
VRQDRPHEYLKIVAAVLPKQMQLEDLTPKRKAEDLTDDELANIAVAMRDGAFIAASGARAHKTPQGSLELGRVGKAQRL